MTLAIPRLDRSTAAERGLTLADFLVPIRVGERTPTRLRHVVLIVAGALVVALSAQVVIPTQPVPFTGQTFGVLTVGAALGFRRGALALLLYIAIGALGLSVFAEGTSGVAQDRRRDRRVSDRLRRRRPRSSAAWPSSAGTVTSAGRSRPWPSGPR